MLKYIYDVFLTNDKNNAPDLINVGLPMLLADARNNKREYIDDRTDLEQLHADYEQLAAQEQDMRHFITRHYNDLCDAYKASYEAARAAFDAVVAQCEQADKEAEAE